MTTPAELVRAITEALNRGDVDAMLAFMDPGFEWRPLKTSPVARACRGHDEVRHYVEDWLGTFEGLRLEIEELTEDGNRVIAVVRGHGRGRGSGLQLHTGFCQVWTVRDGIALSMEEHETLDEAVKASDRRA